MNRSLYPWTVGMLLAFSTAAHAQFTPSPGSPFTAGLSPVFVAIGDFNGKGRLDLAVVNQSDNTLTVLLGNGLGGYTPAPDSPFTTQLVPFSVAIADFNGDGKADVAVSNADLNSITVLLGDGAGGFTPAPGSPVATGLWPQSVVAGDFNGDGKIDLATTNTHANTVTVLLGNGLGGFTPVAGSPTPVGSLPIFAALGDFNRDGKLDLAIANSGDNTVTLLLGNGTGGFTVAAGSPIAVGSSPSSIAVGDFNGDNLPDIVITNHGASTLTLLLGNGSGGFTPAFASPITVGTNPASVAIGDFNEDGKLDLAVANGGSNNVTVLLGNGSAGFTPLAGSPFAVGGTPTYVAVADLNRDGKPDIAVSNSSPGNVSVLLNHTPCGHVLFENNTTAQVTVHYYGGAQGNVDTGWNWLDIPGAPGWKLVGSADFDGNGVQDLVWMNTTTRQATVNYYGGLLGATYLGWNWLNEGGAIGWTLMAVADMNGDGVPDLIWQNDATNQVTVNYYGGTLGSVYQGWNYLIPGGEPAGWQVVGAADFDGNGTPDLVWEFEPTRQVTVNYFGGAGGAEYMGWNWLNPGGSPGWSVVGTHDYDGNGIPDLIWQNDTTAQVTVNYFGGAGGASYLGWNYLSSSGFPGWMAVGPQ